MEKYRKFADEATGHNPFLPHPLNKPTAGAKVLYYVNQRVLTQTLGLVLLLLRLVLLVLLALLYFVLEFLGGVEHILTSWACLSLAGSHTDLSCRWLCL